jgi:hypothetical protein
LFLVAWVTEKNLVKIISSQLLDKPLSDSSTVIVFALIGLSFVVGHFLDLCAKYLEKGYLKANCLVANKLKEIIENNCKRYSENYSLFIKNEAGTQSISEGDINEKNRNFIFLKYDWLRIKDPVMGATAAKILAESRMFGAFLTVIFLTIIVHFIYSYLFNKSSLNCLLLLISLIIGIASFLGQKHCLENFQNIIMQSCYAITTDKEKS